MDVKEVQSSQKARPGKEVQANQTKPLQRALSSLSLDAVNTSRTDTVQLNAEPKPRAEAPKEREVANSVINVINFVSEATAEIEKLVRSVDGIVEQVDGQDIPKERASVLEDEANTLIAEIRKRANTPAPNGARPLAGEGVRVELEEKIGRSLEVILPDSAKNAFGIGPVQLSTADTIIQTRANIEEGRRRLQDLKTALVSVEDEVRKAVSELEVAIQNGEASEVNIRDVDQAAELTAQIRTDIEGDPKQALGSVGDLEEQSARQLLK